MTQSASRAAPLTPPEVLRNAQVHFDQAIETFQGIVEKIRCNEAVSPGEADKVTRSLHAATQTLFNARKKVDDDLRREEGVVYDYAVDLDEAEAQICGLLDSLRAAGDSDEISGGS